MATRTQIGNVCTEASGDEFTIYIEQWADEEPSAIVVDGKACYLIFDPGTTEGRAQIRTFAARLNEAMAVHSARVEEIYSTLKPGDHCGDIRLPLGDEKNCPHTIATSGHTWQCSRVHHEDFHHVAIGDDYQVVAVRHATDHVLSAKVPGSVR